MDDKLSSLNPEETIEHARQNRKGSSNAFDTFDADPGIGALVEGVSSVAQGIAGAGRALGGHVSKLIPGNNRDANSGEGGGFSGDDTTSSLISSIGGTISRTAGTVLDGAGSLVGSTTEGAGRALSSATEGLGHVVSNAGSLASGAGEALSSAADIAGTVLSGAGEVAGAAGEAAGDILGGLGDILN